MAKACSLIRFDHVASFILNTDHRRQSQESRMEFGLGPSRRFRGANNLDC
jgi:hypothetical protein